MQEEPPEDDSYDDNDDDEEEAETKTFHEAVKRQYEEWQHQMQGDGLPESIFLQARSLAALCRAMAIKRVDESTIL